MKARQIEKLLRGVMNSFLDSIEDKNIQKIIKEKSFITGGCIPSMLIDEFVNDYDIYFHTSVDVDIVREYFKSQKPDYTKKYHVKLITDNAINLSDKIQLITKFTGSPSEVTDKFDWQHIKSYYDCNTEKLHLTSDVYQLVVEKDLIYTGSDYPLSSLMRLKKYIKKGWNVSNTTILHIALDFVEAMNKKEEERRKSEASDFINYNGITNIEVEKAVIKNKQFNVDDIIHHMNGVDPIIIQNELSQHTGQYKTIKEIIEIMKGE
jgi:hypothetical protein